MDIRRTVSIALGIVALPLVSGCSVFGGDSCKDAQEHYCSRLPTFDCQDTRMTEAVNNVKKECGETKARDFFQRAIGRCERDGAKMSCPTD